MNPPLPPVFLRRPLTHRGLHDRARGVIENSAGAVRAAVAQGYGIEIDVQLASDGAAMVFHDDKLDRLTPESGPIRGWASRDLVNVTLTGSSETVPTLPEVLEIVDGQVPLLIELKDQSDGNGVAPDELERAVAAALKDYDGPVAVMSFNPYMVANLAKRAPSVPRGIVTDGYNETEWPDLAPDTLRALREIGAFHDVGASFISHNRADLAAPRVAELKASGVPILCWTVRSPEQEAEARRVADNITFEGYIPDEGS
ncbi:glycerophosphodiester phosphodiesterase family protein [Gymnodinialimonas ceratoperidinii]|uniref:Phosphodiesterase n=1 Tax=Gymnodinialimonas ceratoperidinii TaxID=2856823 RepID=A0A8F6YAB5_9RHOB|nr:glycerophosphodiester phosphodiesterase family protein [Gymnodinialimonas ceratoperidinii]QXT39789.1 phosphodiesterase [Gymnodinialimonas ceratoperidinii]